MQWRNSSRRYGIISMCLHWLFAIAVYAMFGLGLWMVTLSYYDGWYHQAPELHKSIGVLLMGNDSNLLIVFYVQIMPDDFVMQLHR
ncbi:cytochrome b/b6 domain-containing protein, partial [Enterobacter hormaechei]